MKKLIQLFTLTMFVVAMSSFAPETDYTDKAYVWKTNSKRDVNTRIYDRCNNEWVDFTGTIHYNYHTVRTNGFYSTKRMVNYSNMKGVGRTSGNEYDASQNFKDSSKTNSCTRTSTNTDNVKLIGKGKAPNINLTYTYTRKINYCDRTSSRDYSRDITCK